MTEWNNPAPAGEPAGPLPSPWAPGGGEQQAAAPGYGQQPPAAPDFGDQPPTAPGFGQQPPSGPGEFTAAFPPAAGNPAPGDAPPSYGQSAYPAAAGYPAPAEHTVQTDPYAVPPRKSKLPYLIAAAVTVVALVAGGLVWAKARGLFTASGAASPTAAVQNLFDALGDDDLAGAMRTVAPSEASLISDISGDVIDQLKRLQIVKEDATTDQLLSLHTTVSGLTVDPDTMPVNDRVQVVRVTAGVITVDGGSAESVLTDKIRDASPDWSETLGSADLPGELLPQDLNGPETFDIASQATATGGAVRIATILEDGEWYVSLAYTVADNVAYTELGPHYAADLRPLAAAGAATPELAMDGLIAAILSGDVRTMAATLDPGTLGAVQDYASAIFGDSACLTGGGVDDGPDSGTCQPLDVNVTDAQWSTAKVSGGQRVMVDKLTLRTPDGDVSIVRDAKVPSLTISAPGEQPIVVSPDQADGFVRDIGSLFGFDPGDASPEVTAIIQRELTELLQWGVTMVQGADGQWYVSPIHTFSDLFLALLRGLQPGDIDYFLAHGN